MNRRIVVGDIHGCSRTFQRLLEERIKLEKGDILILTGDYIDRGPDSRAVIDYIIWLQHESYHLVTLMGTHEYLLLHSQGSMEYYKLWMLNSGFTTLRDFGIDVSRYPGPEAIHLIPDLYLRFFRELSYYAETPGYFISHACFEGRTADPLDDLQSMIWKRDEYYNEEFLNGRKLIHGHTPEPMELIRGRVMDPATRIYNIDGGCVYPKKPGLGYLCAFDLDSRDFFAQKNCE
jgi:serine/threonine protein phosphatase 1